MSTTVSQLYEQAIKPLSAADRLQLATLILNDIPPEAVGEYRSEWSEEDQKDAARHSLQRAARSFGEEDA